MTYSNIYLRANRHVHLPGLGMFSGENASRRVNADPASPHPYAESERSKRRQSRPQQDRSFQLSPVTYTLLAVNVLIYLAMYIAGHGDVSSVSTLFGDKDNQLIQAGQWWRFITPIFLHGSLIHLGSNSLFLYILGSQMEQIYGSKRYFLVYMIAGILSFVVSYEWSSVPSLGASGALFGLVGAGLVFPVRFRSLVPEQARSQILSQLLFTALINLAIGAYPGSHIDNGAHMGGLIGGAFTALFLMPEVLDDRPKSAATQAVPTLFCMLFILLSAVAGASQWKWAHKQVLAPAMVQVGFGLKGQNPWWSLSVPADWKHPKPSIWVNRDGAEFLADDNVGDPVSVNQAAQMIQKEKEGVSQVTIDGQRAFHLQLEGDGKIINFYLIKAYDRFVLLQLVCPSAAFTRAESEFSMVISSVRFVHAPEDIPIPKK